MVILSCSRSLSSVPFESAVLHPPSSQQQLSDPRESHQVRFRVKDCHSKGCSQRRREELFSIAHQVYHGIPPEDLEEL